MASAPARSHSAAASAGVEGNTRLTAATGAVVGVLLLLEAVTVLDVRGMITLHLFVGLMLIPPVLLKSVATIYRFASYYGGRQPYVDRGPPHIVLRMLGPVVVLSAIGVLATGLWLLAINRHNDTALTLHQASFIVLAVAVSVHFLGHLKETGLACWRELRPTSDDAAARHRFRRLLAVSASLLIGVGLAAALMPASTSVWQQRDHNLSNHAEH